MGTRERRERERDQMRTRILDAARELFASQGYDAVSMRKIAEAIEYSPTAIYVHFKDKAELMRELCHRDFSAMDEDNHRLMEIADPVERIRALGLHYIRFGVTRPNHFRLMFMTKPTSEMAMSEDEMAQAGRGDPNQDGYALLKLSVRQAIEQGRVRDELRDDVEVIVQLLWAAVHGVASLHITRPDKEQWCPWVGADVLGRQIIDTVFRGILKEGDPAVGRTGASEGGGR